MVNEHAAGAQRQTPTMASYRLLVLDFVRKYIGEWKASPSYGEIAAGTGGSRTRVKKAVRSLERGGLLCRRPGPRGLSLPEQHEDAVRLLRGQGWKVNEKARRAAAPVTKPDLLPPAELDYPPRRDTAKGNAGGKADATSKRTRATPTAHQ